MTPLIRVGLSGLLLALPRGCWAADANADASPAGTIADGLGSHLAAGDLPGIYGERRVSDPGAVSGRAPAGTSASANLPGHQLPAGLKTNATAPPALEAAGADGGVADYFSAAKSYASGVADKVSDWWSPPTPKIVTVPNPDFGLAVCAGGQKPPCPMQVMTMGENSSGVPGRITDYVDYGELDGTVFSSPRWWEFWKDGKQVSGDDIHQGGLGDCFLLASLAAIANKQPDILRSMIKRNKATGSTWVKFFDGAANKPVLVGPVDNLFPVYKKGLTSGAGGAVLGGQPVFAKPVGGPPPPLWPLIVEKAYAMAFRSDSYAALNKGGLPGDAMTHITGRPSQWHPGASVGFKDMADWDANGQPITIGTKNAPEGGCPASPAPLAAESSLPGALAKWMPAQGATTDSVCTDPLYQGKIACAPDSTDPVCQASSSQIVRLHTSHAYWVKSVDSAGETVTLANPWGADQPTVVWPWTRLRKSLDFVFVNEN